MLNSKAISWDGVSAVLLKRGCSLDGDIPVPVILIDSLDGLRLLDLRGASAILVERCNRVEPFISAQWPKGTPKLPVFSVASLDGILAATKDEVRVARLEAVAKATPKECICHVRSFDGYYGANHTEACRALTDALVALEAEDDRPSQTDPPTD